MTEETQEERTVDIEDAVQRASTMTRGQIISTGSPNRSNNQRKFLRGLGQSLSPVVYVGARGAIRSVVKAVEEQLEIHELIKIRVHESAGMTPEIAALWLRGETGADIIHIVGHNLVIYKPRKEKPTIKLPRD